MSYDFRLFRPKPGEDPIVTARCEADDFPDTPPDPEKEVLKRRIADALIAHNPRLEVFQVNFEEIARIRKMSVDEARLRFRHLELNTPEDDPTGIQITLWDDDASVTVPYWHEGPEAANVFRVIFSQMEIICREAGYLVYDPHVDRVFDPATGFENALACYRDTIRKVRSIAPASENPWWKFW